MKVVRLLRLPLIITMVSVCGCISTDRVDFSFYGDFPISVETPQKKYIISDYFEVRGYGLNILGMLPIGVVSIDEAVEELIKLAEEAEVDGITGIKIEKLGPPFPWAFILWYKGVRVSGYGYKYIKE